MKRICIFVFYDKNGIVSDYVKYLLIAFKEIVSYQIVVVNGFIQSEFQKELSGLADKIVIRENKGFDAGAYKNIFQNYLSASTLKEYDELILCNDSFYGPFYSFSEIWNRMKNYCVDFWGFTRHPGGILEDGSVFLSHIQSYFITIRKSLFLDSRFQTFWDKEIDYEEKIINVIKEFEIKFTNYFEKQGFTSIALTDLSEYNQMTIQYDENPYQAYSFELISQGICPILKRKCLIPYNEYLEKAFGAYAYIRDQTSYPEELITDHIRRLNRENNWCDGWDIEDLERFYLEHRAVYIYGAGKWGKILQTYFECHKWKVSGILVSEGEKIVGCEQVFHPDILEDTDGIVIALGKKNVKTVADKLKNILAEQQLFIPNYK